MKTYIGIDCGSASVKMALIDEEENLVDSVYLRNKGLTETVQEGLRRISGDYEIRGVGVTGSGREFVKALVGGDLTKTEVLAHTIAVLKYNPDTRVISDIGGEDSKLMIVNEGILEDFVLNQSCSAGTGSSLEAIATRMGIQIEEVGDLALKSTKRLNISTKCGVFMTSASVNFLNSGAKKEDILWGVVRGMVNNYLTMAQGKYLQEPHIYTGMTAKNKAIVKAFNESLSYEIIVPEHAPIMGSIGMALLTKREEPKKTNFRGFEVANREYKTETKICNDCENLCELIEIYQDSKSIGILNSKCGKY